MKANAITGQGGRQLLCGGLVDPSSPVKPGMMYDNIPEEKPIIWGDRVYRLGDLTGPMRFSLLVQFLIRHGHDLRAQCIVTRGRGTLRAIHELGTDFMWIEAKGAIFKEWYRDTAREGVVYWNRLG